MISQNSREEVAIAARNLVIRAQELCTRRGYAAAEKLYQQALELVQRTFGRQHPLLSEVLECYADLLLKTSRQLEGSEMKKRSEAIWETYRLSVLQTAAKLEALNKNETFSESTIDHVR